MTAALPHHLVWLRQDLRLADNTALAAAARDPSCRVSLVYLVTPRQWQAHDVAPARLDLEWRQLQSLHADAGALGMRLVVLTCDDFAAAPATLSDWAAREGITALHANRQYEINEQARDRATETALTARNIPCHWHEDLCLMPPGSVLTGQRQPYTVFSPFKRNWLQQMAQRGVQLLPAPAPRSPEARQAPIALPPRPAILDQGQTVPEVLRQELWPAGEAAAHARLQAFTERDLDFYKRQRDLPAVSGTSTLSPYLAAGILSPRQCLAAAWQHQGALEGRLDVDTWISELIWRDFYKHILVAFPHVCRHRAFKRETDALAWRSDPALLAAWQEGRTGFPIVDAAQRQLLATGWMHNRLRMITAMFFTKDLFLDWRLGERHFMRHLVDGDLAANNGGWQWSASTGNDAAPYFRVFNPWLQGEKFDPDGDFIRRFVPELARCPTKALHDPKAQRPGYPRPIVDHASAKAHAVASFKALGLASSDDQTG